MAFLYCDLYVHIVSSITDTNKRLE